MNAPTSPGRILVLEEDPTLLAETCAKIGGELKGVSVSGVSSFEECRTALSTQSFDLIVLDHTIAQGSGIELIHEAKIQDYDPGVLIVSATEDPHAVASVFNLGCHRYLVKQGEWLTEIGPAARSALRLKKLEYENRVLIGKLTEANRLLSEKNTRLDEFSATVSHDIRGVLGGLAMRLDYILDLSKESLNEKLLKLIENARDAASRVQEIVQGTYDFSKLGPQALKKCELDLNTLVNEVIADMQFDEKLNIRVGLDELPIVVGSKPLLQRVFINLITNAVRYNDKTEVIINIGVSRIFENGLGRFCDIFVEDNGAGIEEANLPQIFRMFWQERPGQKSDDGTGIGLAVVKRVVELHLGSISVKSKKGEGTRFTFSLPLEEINFL